MVEPLLKAGANAKLRGYRGRLPIHMAAASGHATLVQTLLSHSPQGKVRMMYNKISLLENIIEFKRR